MAGLKVFFWGGLRLGRIVGPVTGSDWDCYSHTSDDHLLPFNTGIGNKAQSRNYCQYSIFICIYFMTSLG